MKASSSSNSLISLTIDTGPECIVCLDSGPNSLSEYVMNPLKLRVCSCHFPVHPKCWTEWIKVRNTCPICRRQIILSRAPQPIIVVEVEENESIQKNVFILFTICIIIAIILVLVFVVR